MKNGIPRSHATTGQFAPIVSVQQIAAVTHFVRYGLLSGRNDVAGLAKNSEGWVLGSGAAVTHSVRYGLLLERNDVAGFAKNSVW